MSTRNKHVRKVVFPKPKPMAGTVSSANGRNSDDASTEDIGQLINPHITTRREVAATPNVTAADVTMPIMTSDKTLAEAQAGGQMRVGRMTDEDGSVKTIAAKRSSERLKKLDRTATVGCSEFLATQKRSRISRSFSEGAKGTGEAFFDNSPAVDENEEATGLLQTLADTSPQATDNPPLEELAIKFMTQASNWFGVELDTDEATRLLRDRDSRCNLDEALEAYRREHDRFKRTVSTPELPNIASSAQSTSETGVHGAIGLQRGRLSPKSGMSNPVVTLKEPNEQQNLRDWINEICTMRVHYLEEGDSATPPHLRKFSPLLDIQLIESLSEAERAGMDARTPMLSF
jgi:hypothetical protein